MQGMVLFHILPYLTFVFLSPSLPWLAFTNAVLALNASLEFAFWKTLAKKLQVVLQHSILRIKQFNKCVSGESGFLFHTKKKKKKVLSSLET